MRAYPQLLHTYPDAPEQDGPEVAICIECGWPDVAVKQYGDKCRDCIRIAEEDADTCKWCGDPGATDGVCRECANQGIDYEPINQ